MLLSNILPTLFSMLYGWENNIYHALDWILFAIYGH